MTAYSQLSDAELERKVQELMGYYIESPADGLFVLLRKSAELPIRCSVPISPISYDEDKCWSHAPSPMTDANVTMALVDELIDMDQLPTIYFERGRFPGDINTGVSIEHGEPLWVDGFNLPRAVCEVYCMVKEGK